MKAICPNNEAHDQFTTSVHVMQEWVVDASGDYIETSENFLQITHKPNPDNIWICHMCGADAKVVEWFFLNHFFTEIFSFE